MKKYNILMLIVIMVLMFNCMSNVFAASAKYAMPFKLPELTGDMRQDFINVAHSQLGYEEASDESTVFGAWADDPYQHWCSEFAAWCAEKANIPTTIIPKKKSCAGYRKFFAQKNQYYYVKEGVAPDVSEFTQGYESITSISITDARVGDIILQETNDDYTNGPDHTAIFLENTSDGVKTISGNSSDKVRIKIINVKDIHGLCKPDFEQEIIDVESYLEKAESEEYSDWVEKEIKEAIDRGILPKQLQNNYKSNITRAEFCVLLTKFLEVKTGKTIGTLIKESETTSVFFSDTNYEYVKYMCSLGITGGVGDGKFNPLGEITREQAATLLMRVSGFLNYSLLYDCNVEIGVSEWAKDGVGFVTERGIMNGTGDGFEPQGKFTKEQAIATIVRMCNS